MHDVSNTSVHAPVLESNVSFSTTLSNSRGQPDGDGVTEGDGGVSEGDGDGMEDAVVVTVLEAEREADTVSVDDGDGVNDSVSDTVTDALTEPDALTLRVADTDTDSDGETVTEADPDGEPVPDTETLGVVVELVDVDGVGDTHAPSPSASSTLSMPNAASMTLSLMLH